MVELEHVLHKRTLPTNVEQWHITLQGHPEELLDALTEVIKNEPHVIQTAEWIAADQLVICLRWIDDVIRNLVEQEIYNVSFDIKIKYNGREKCHGHNLPMQTT